MKLKDEEEEEKKKQNGDENRTNLRLESRIRSHFGLVIAFELDCRALHPVRKKVKLVQRNSAFGSRTKFMTK